MKKVKRKVRDSIAKRFKVTKTGKVKHAKTNRRHILTSKTRKAKRHARHSSVLGMADEARIRVLLEQYS